MPGNSFGQAFTYQTWGESHGPAIGVVIDGVPPLMKLSEADIQPFLDARRPGQNRFTTQRQEPDQVKILSGVFEGVTTGTPIACIIENVDARSKDYGDIAQKFRPGHADYTYQQKYGVRDYRGGGRSSARETACRVIAGAIARQVLAHVLGHTVTIRAAVVQIGTQKIDNANWDWACVSQNPFFTPDAQAVPNFEIYLDDIRKQGLSAGALIALECVGLPAGLGEPVIDKLDADLAKALMSINAAKAVSIGAGFDVVGMTGLDNADAMRQSAQGGVDFLSNHAGGILGGISTGQPITAQVAIKPTSSILTSVQTVDMQGENTDIITKGRHDPCVGIRAVPVVEAMAAIVLADHLLRFRAQCGKV